MGFLLPKEIWNNTKKKKGLCVNSKATLLGHFETWVKPRSTYFINKTMFIDVEYFFLIKVWVKDLF